MAEQRSEHPPELATPDLVDDRFRSLLEGLRTTLPGVQVLFAFLLVLPFQASFGELSGAKLAAYSVAFFGSALASILLIAPSVHQRMRAPISGVRRTNPRHLAAAVWVSIVGTILSLVALAAAVYLVTSVLYPAGYAVAAAVVVLLVAGWSWVYQPVVQFRHDGDD